MAQYSFLNRAFEHTAPLTPAPVRIRFSRATQSLIETFAAATEQSMNRAAAMLIDSGVNIRMAVTHEERIKAVDEMKTAFREAFENAGNPPAETLTQLCPEGYKASRHGTKLRLPFDTKVALQHITEKDRTNHREAFAGLVMMQYGAVRGLINGANPKP